MLKSKISLKNDSRLDKIRQIIAPYTQRVYLVGGSVRDRFLGLEFDDFDLEFYDIKPEFFENLMQKLGANGVGKSFFVYKYKNFDLALARVENKSSYGHKGFEVQICNDEKQGAKRRDFTINSMMINIFNDEFLDFYQGRKDLEQKILRVVDEKSFVEDSLRVLRAVHFIARFKLDLEYKSFELMKNMDISDLSSQRINAELYKFFKAPHLVLGFEALQDLDLEKKIFYTNTSKNKDLAQFKTLLHQARACIDDEGLFLYLYLNFFGFDKKLFFEKRELKKELFIKSKQPFFKERLSDAKLLFLACDMALKNWLGLWDKECRKRAKELGIYEQKFTIKFDVEALKQQGFSGKVLGTKLKALRKEFIKAYLKKLNSSTKNG